MYETFLLAETEMQGGHAIVLSFVIDSHVQWQLTT